MLHACTTTSNWAHVISTAYSIINVDGTLFIKQQILHFAMKQDRKDEGVSSVLEPSPLQLD
jgi:hypothetical protein